MDERDGGGGRLGGAASVRVRIEEMRIARPVGSAPADAVIDRALDLFEKGGLAARDLPSAISRLEARLRTDMPDLKVFRALRPASPAPRHVALVVCEPRVMTGAGFTMVSLQSHAIVLTPTAVHAVHGFLPGWARGHFFERVEERLGGLESVTGALLAVSGLWPTLLLMRARQRRRGVGDPVSAIVTPFAGGLLFGDVRKVEGMPPFGMTATLVDVHGRRRRVLRDWFADQGDRLFVQTKTFVDAGMLKNPQLELVERLTAFTDRYADVVAEADWRWRIGFGQRDATVEAIATSLGLRPVDAERLQRALDDLETLVSSDLWRNETRQSKANMVPRRRSGPVRKGR